MAGGSFLVGSRGRSGRVPADGKGFRPLFETTKTGARRHRGGGDWRFPAAARCRTLGAAMNRAVFLDRDGVIIRTDVADGKPVAITSLDALEVLDGVEQAMQRLRAAGFLNIVVTNQPDVVTGRTTRETADAIHRALMAALPIDAIKACYEVDGPDATCYKPKPGMLIEAVAEHDIDLARSYMVGDRWRDVGAGKAAGCHTVFIDHGYDEPLTETPDTVVRSLAEAADAILRLEHGPECR